MTKLIYILGAGRSGTTLLDIVLGNQDSLCSCGELNRFPKRNGIPPLITNENKLNFWENYRNQLQEELNVTNLREYIRVTDKFEYHSGYIASFFYRSNKDYEKYSEYLFHFFNILSNLITTPTIIDSSKYPGRLYNLVKLGYDVKVIYLIREPSMVVRSFERKNIEQPSKNSILAIAYYFSVNLLCHITIALLGPTVKSVKIKYEDFIQNPAGILQLISEKLDVELGDLIGKVMNDENLLVGNLFDGNRIRLKNEIEIIRERKEKPNGLKYFIARFLNLLFYN